MGPLGSSRFEVRLAGLCYGARDRCLLQFPFCMTVFSRSLGIVASQFRWSLVPRGPFGPLGLLGLSLPESRRRCRLPKPILPEGGRVGVKHDSFCCNVPPGGCLLSGRRSMARWAFGGPRLGSLGSLGVGSIAGVGLLVRSVDLVDRMRSRFESFCQRIDLSIASAIG